MVKCRVVHKELLDHGGGYRNERMLIDCEGGEVVADIDPDRCWIRWYQATPKKTGLGRDALPLVESRLRKGYGCGDIGLMPGSEGDKVFWGKMGYREGEHRGFHMWVKEKPIKLEPWPGG